MQDLSCLKVLFQVIVFIALTCYASKQECGQRKVNHVNLILRGQRAYPGKWPWHVTISHRTYNEIKIVCGGSIIDKYTILTAAHCLYTEHGVISINRLDVHIGRSELGIKDPHTRAYTPDEFLLHTGYRPNNVKDDIALIRLGNEIELNDYVQPVCVCPAENDTEIVGRIGTVVGFGMNENNTGERNRVGPCNGDSGGGLLFQTNTGWCVRGIVSFSPMLNGLCDPQQYVAYTDVAKYINWLRNNKNETYYSVKQTSFNVTPR